MGGSSLGIHPSCYLKTRRINVPVPSKRPTTDLIDGEEVIGDIATLWFDNPSNVLVAEPLCERQDTLGLDEEAAILFPDLTGKCGD